MMTTWHFGADLGDINNQKINENQGCLTLGIGQTIPWKHEVHLGMVFINHVCIGHGLSVYRVHIIHY